MTAADIRSSSNLSDTERNRLSDDLRHAIAGEVGFDRGARALYATDASNYRQTPIGVVLPRNAEDVVAAMRVCRKHRVPVLSRGGGTSLAGQCCNTAVVFDMSRHFNRVIAIDNAGRRARVEPGCVLDELRDAAERFHLTFGPDPSTHNHNTLGGMIGNNSCGVHSVMAGRTADNVERLEILTYDGLRMWVGATSEDELEAIIAAGGRRGDIYRQLRSLRDRYAELIRQRFPRIPRRVSGYNLDELLPENGFNVARALVGSEGTCVAVLAAELRLVDSPPGRALVALGYQDVYAAGDHVPEILRHKPIGLEGIDDRLIEFMKRKSLHEKDLDLLPEGGGWLLVEFGGPTRAAAQEAAAAMMDRLRAGSAPPSMKAYDDAADEKRLWGIREAGLGATAWVPDKPDAWPGWEDAAVPPEHVGQYLREFRALLQRYGYECSLYGHFGDGCIHVRIDFDLVSSEGRQKYKSFIDAAADLVLSHGGSLSGEHGDGQARGAQLKRMFGPELMQAFADFKHIWDPEGRMNPGKLPDADPPDAHLRLKENNSRSEPKTNFSFPSDDGKFSRAALRCVGVGECRRHDGGVMCPSYMATRQEQHSTRGRARLLFEMLRGDPLDRGWRSKSVHEALDLCLSCKGCLHDCPVNVDMATYKSEFFSHYYRHRLRPRAAWSMGMIYYWSRIAALSPAVANFLGQTPGFRHTIKFAADIAPARRLPRFANPDFRTWFRHRATGEMHGGQEKRVMLWPDTFNTYYRADTAIAAVEVLEHLGYEVVIPDRPLCCGRPLYAWGMLDLARHQLQQVLDTIGGEIQAGTPLIGLEPACMSVFHNEMPNLFPDNPTAQKLKTVSYLLPDFLVREGHSPPPLQQQVMVHGHCHHHAIFGLEGECNLFDRMQLDYRLLDSGCCGMAGAFGFERPHYDVAMAAGERVLLPEVRAAPEDTLIVADGFSCREQIAQSTSRQALHTAELLRLALRTASANAKV